jgi:hypothetical protein
MSKLEKGVIVIMTKIRKVIFKGLLLILGLVIAISLPLIVDADGMDFDVRIFPTDTQRRQDVPGFDLLLAPGDQEIIEIEVRNISDEPITLVIEIATATTDDGGTIFYRPREGLVRDNTLPYAMEDIASIDGERFDLEGGESLRVPITIQMPQSTFYGMILGGISILQYVDLEEARATAEGVLIYRFRTEIPVRLQNDETSLQPDLNLIGIGASQRNWRNIFAANLQNPEMMLIHAMEVHAFISRAGEVEVLYEEQIGGMQVAPNSNFTLAIPLGGERFQAGYHDLHLEVTAYNGNWSFRERFYVSAEEAAAFNATDVTITRIPLWIFIAAGGGVLALLFILYMVLFRRKSKKTRNNALDEVMKQINMGSD